MCGQAITSIHMPKRKDAVNLVVAVLLENMNEIGSSHAYMLHTLLLNYELVALFVRRKIAKPKIS